MTRAMDRALDLVRLGVFAVDAAGRVWRLIRIGPRQQRIPCRPYRAESPQSAGYLSVHVPGSGSVLAHRLVWWALRGEIPPSLEINHRDGDRTNNHPDNLEVVTHSENNLHAYRVLGRAPTVGPLGEAHHQSVLKADDVRAIREILADGRVRRYEVAAHFGVSTRTVTLIRQRRAWRHVGGPAPAGIAQALIGALLAERAARRSAGAQAREATGK